MVTNEDLTPFSPNDEYDWQLILDHIDNAIFIADEQGKILDANESACQMLGYSLDDLKEMLVRDLDIDHTPDELEVVPEQITSGKWITEQTHLKKKDGKILPASVKVGCYFHNDKKIMISVIQDLSEHEAYLQTLIDSQERMQLATQAARMGIWEWKIVENKLIWDDCMLSIYGLTRKKFDNDFGGWLSMVHPDDREAAQNTMDRAVAGEIEYNTEYRIVRPDQKTRTVKSTGQVIRNNSGNPIRFLGIDLDITEETMIKNANEIMTDVQWQIIHAENEGDIYTLVGQNIQKILGDGYVCIYQLDEAHETIHVVDLFESGSTIANLIKSQNVDPRAARIKVKEIRSDHLSLFRSGKLHSYKKEQFSINFNEIPRTFFNSIENEMGITAYHLMGFSWEGRHYGGMIVAAKDDISPVLSIIESIINLGTQVVKKLRADKALQLSELRFRDLFEESPISLWEEDLSDLMLYLADLEKRGVEDFREYFTNNPAEVAHCGKLLKVLNMNKASVELLHAKSKKDLITHMEKIFGGPDYPEFTSELIAFAEGKKDFSWEGKNYTLDGDPRIFDLKFSIPPTYESSYKKVFVSAIDVTEKHRAEQLLSERERQYSVLMKNLPGMVYRCKDQNDWPMLYVSEGCRELTGYSPEEFESQKLVYGDIVLEEDRQTIIDQTQSSSAQDVPFQYSYRIRSKDSQIKWVWEQGRKVISYNGEKVYEGYITDITEQRVSEVAKDMVVEIQKQVAKTASTVEICRLIGKKVHELLSRAVVVVTYYSEASDTSKLIDHFGFEKDYAAVIERYSLEVSGGLRAEKVLDESSFKQFSVGKLIQLENGWYDLLSHKYSRKICGAISKELDNPHLYVIGLTRRGKLIGNLAVISRPDIRRYIDAIEMLVNQATVLIDRADSERVLRESEERFRQVFEESPIGIVLSDNRSLITNINPVFSAITGYEPWEVIGHTFREFTYPEDVSDNEAMLNQLAKLKIPYFTMQKRYIHKDGNLIWVNITVSAIRNQNGDLTSHLTMIEDITEKKKAEEALQHEQYLMQALMDNIPDSVYYKDKDSRFIRVNKATAIKFGTGSEEELLGKSDADYFPEEVAKENLEEELEIMKTGKPMINWEAIEVWKDGRPTTWSTATKMPLRDRTGKIIGTFGLSRDITDRKAKEEEIKRLNADLEKRVEARTKELHLRNQELEAFSYSISHDLKAPLRGITGYSQLLLQEHSSQLDEEGKAFLEKLTLSSDQLNELIDDLLAYSHLERRPVNRTNFSIKEIINIVLDERKNDLAQNNFQVHQQIEDEVIQNSSTELVTQVLRSYLDNAIKFTSQKTDPQIWISYTHDTVSGIITFRDNGIGFDPKYTDRIFDVFYRLHRIDEFSGTGIGLALAKKAADILGYRVWASGEVNNGSSFFLEIKKSD